MKKTTTIFAAMMVFCLLSATAGAQNPVRRGGSWEAGGKPVRDIETPGHLAGAGTGWMDEFKKENPEDFDRLQKLRTEDPEKFREELRRRMKERMERGMQHRASRHDAACEELRRAYREAETDEQKAEIKVKLEGAVQEAFDARLADQKEMVERLEKQLEKLKEQIATREANRAEICARRVGELTDDPELRW